LSWNFFFFYFYFFIFLFFYFFFFFKDDDEEREIMAAFFRRELEGKSHQTGGVSSEKDKFRPSSPKLLIPKEDVSPVESLEMDQPHYHERQTSSLKRDMSNSSPRLVLSYYHSTNKNANDSTNNLNPILNHSEGMQGLILDIEKSSVTKGKENTSSGLSVEEPSPRAVEASSPPPPIENLAKGKGEVKPNAKGSSSDRGKSSSVNGGNKLSSSQSSSKTNADKPESSKSQTGKSKGNNESRPVSNTTTPNVDDGLFG
jgi:hypothetical protein